MKTPQQEQIYMTLPFYGEKMKQKGVSFNNLKLVEHFYIPNEKDLMKIIEFIEGCKTCVDIGSGYGLLITQLSKKITKTDFLGIDTLYWEQNKFPIPKSKPNLKFKFHGLEAMAYADKRNMKVKRFDCVICCWMPHGSDWREMLTIICNKKIILILSKDFATGTLETYCGLKEFGFKLKNKAWISKESLVQLWEKE